MDVLKPPILNIDGRCYRLNPVQRPPEWVEHEDEMEGYDEMYDDEYNEESCELLDIKETDKGYTLNLEIPSGFFGHIIGKNKETKKKIERETKTQIVFPKAHSDEDLIVIRGEQKSGIISAKTRIDVIVSSARQREPFTHFLSMPFNSAPTQNKLREFTEDVLRDSRGDEGLDVSLFQKPAKLHLTLGTLVLMSRKEVAQAQELLKQCKQDVINPILQDSFLLVNLKGLEYMNDDPGKVDVLYAKAELKDGSNKLQLICDSVAESFTRAGLMQKEYERVKVHITLINTIFRKEPDAEDGSRRGKGKRDGEGDRVRESIDASRILQEFGDYSFGDCLINTIHISQRGSYGVDGYYLPVGSVTLP
ncbi:activating signal cointegrator 1 complex subunit 1-like isoform X2 [Asterias amurensis]